MPESLWLMVIDFPQQRAHVTISSDEHSNIQYNILKFFTVMQLYFLRPDTPMRDLPHRLLYGMWPNGKKDAFTNDDVYYLMCQCVLFILGI